MLTCVQQQEGSWRVRQAAVRPCVYLDHWALDQVGSDPELAATLIAALQASGGTLCISVVNAAEACKASDPKHARRIDTFLAAAMPQIAMVDLGAMAISEGIPDTAEGEIPVYALGDPPLERQLAFEFAMIVSKPNGIGWVESAWLQRERRGDILSTVSANIATRWDEERQKEAWRDRARTAPLNRPAKRAWRVIADVMRPAVINTAQSIPVNDGADCLHALVLPYCDFVLLDHKWADRAESTRRRFEKHGEKIGKTISQRTGGVAKLVEELLAFG